MPPLTPRLAPPRNGRVGLLGGSFNPAHAGHLRISRIALERLGLDQVWWLVSPQNPLKPEAGMAPLGERLAAAAGIARDPRIHVTGIEQTLGTRYTVDTLAVLRRRFPRVRFVWIMGADNLIQIARWHRWPEVFAIVPVAVFTRPPYSLRALTGVAARRFATARRRESRARALADLPPPAWVFLTTWPNAVSATRIRAGLGGKARSGTRGQGEEDQDHTTKNQETTGDGKASRAGAIHPR